MRRSPWVRRRISSKPDACTETADVYAAGISVKVARLTLGGLSRCPCANRIVRCGEGVTEVSRGHTSGANHTAKGRTWKTVSRRREHGFSQ